MCQGGPGIVSVKVKHHCIRPHFLRKTTSFNWNSECGDKGGFCLFFISCSTSKALQEGKIDSLHIASVQNKVFLFKSVGRINV